MTSNEYLSKKIENINKKVKEENAIIESQLFKVYLRKIKEDPDNLDRILRDALVFLSDEKYGELLDEFIKNQEIDT